MSDTEQTTNAPKSKDKRLRIALAVSVALNVAVLGMVSGAALTGGGPERRAGDFREFGFVPFTEALSREDRDAMRRAFLAQMPDMRAVRSEMRNDQQEILAALRAKPFDQARMNTAFEVHMNRSTSQLVAGQEVLLDLLGQMSEQERIDFAGRLEERLKRGRDKPKPPPPQP